MTLGNLKGGTTIKELLPWEVDRNAVGIVTKQQSPIGSSVYNSHHYCYDEYSNRIFRMSTDGSVAFDEFDGTTFKIVGGYTQSSNTGNLYHISGAVRRGKYVYGFSGKSSASFAYITQYNTESGTKTFINVSDKIDVAYSTSTGSTIMFESTHKNYALLRQRDSNYDRFYRIEFDDEGQLTKITNLNALLTGASSTYHGYAAPGVIKRIHNSNEHFFAYSLTNGYANKWICGVCNLSLENPVIWKTESSTLSPFATNSNISDLMIYKHYSSGEYYSVFTDSTSVKLRHFNKDGVISDTVLTKTTASQYTPHWVAGKVYKNVALITEVLGSSTDNSQTFFAKINEDGTWDYLINDSKDMDAYGRMSTEQYYKYPYSFPGYVMHNRIAEASNANYPHTESADGRLRFVELYGNNWVAPAFIQMAIKVKK